MFQIGALTGTVIKAKTRETLRQIIHSLVRIAYRADQGDDKAADQLRVLHKVAHPKSYELPATVIKSLADRYHTSPHLARAWDVRGLMLDLSYVVEPTQFDRSVLDGPVKLTTHSVHLHRELYDRAARHVRKGTTLLSLATTIYIEELDREGITLDPRQIKRDLQKLKEWEVVNLKDDSLHQLPLWSRAGEYLPANLPGIPIYSDGWKRLWRRGGKNRK